jgi:hypothetical protein
VREARGVAEEQREVERVREGLRVRVSAGASAGCAQAGTHLP